MTNLNQEISAKPHFSRAIQFFAVVFAVFLFFSGPLQAKTSKPNILVIFGDGIGFWNVSYNNDGMVGYRTPNIGRLANHEFECTF